VQPITITVPAINPQIIASLELQQAMTFESELLAVQALRKRCAPLVAYAGYIKVGHRPGAKIPEKWVRHQGRKCHGMLAYDSFEKTDDRAERGEYTGERLFLVHDGWIFLRRTGYWSTVATTPDYWTCGEVFDSWSWTELAQDGETRAMTDEQVATAFHVGDLANGLAQALQVMVKTLPEQTVRIRQMQLLADKLTAALKV
jgi:hypothetical protein